MAALEQIASEGKIDFHSCQPITEYGSKGTMWGIDGGTFVCSPSADEGEKDRIRKRQQLFKNCVSKYSVVNGCLVQPVERITDGVTNLLLRKVVTQDEACSAARQVHRSKGHPGLRTTYNMVASIFSSINNNELHFVIGVFFM